MFSYQKFSDLCEKEQVTPYLVAQKTGVATSTLSEWKNGNYFPKLNKVIEIAKFFSVPIEYFIEEI